MVNPLPESAGQLEVQTASGPAAKSAVLQLVYTEKAAELRAETETANRLMAGYVTVQIGLATWLFANPPRDMSLGVGVFLANACIAVCVWLLINRNYGRRGEILETLQATIDALQLSVPSVYLSERVVQKEAFGHSWRPVHRAVVVILGLMQLIPLGVPLIRALHAAP